MKTHPGNFHLIIIFLLYVFAEKGRRNHCKKNILITKTSSSPKIDGILDDAVWQNAPIATNFIERNPNNGKPQADSSKNRSKNFI
jgi:hypothetical protein